MKCPSLQTSRLHRGMALITALMVMSLATMTAVSMTAEQQIYFRRAENILLHEQAYQYLVSAEDFAKLVLQDDFKKNTTDSLKDDWAQQGAVFPIEGGMLTGTISDLQGKFNINNLATGGKPKQWDVNRLQKLLARNNLSPNLANAIIDWLDPDEEPTFPDGAEDVDYLQGEHPHRAGNGMMGSVSELLYVKGIDFEAYQAIAPALVVLPVANVAININTATPQVLQMIIDPLTESEANELHEELTKNPVNDPQEIASHPMLAGKKIDLNGIGVESSYFLLQSYVEIGRARARMDSVINRFNEEKITVVLRSQGGI